MNERQSAREALTKVPAVTLGFWIIKVLATTLGETGGDTVTMTWLGETTDHPFPNGYLIGTIIFGILLMGLVFAQIRARKFNPWLYWATIVASTTCGTTLADFADRSLGVGYPGASLLLLACVLLSLFTWYKAVGTVDVNTVIEPREETFYWITITFSQTLGTALGDWIADAGLGYSGGRPRFRRRVAGLGSALFHDQGQPGLSVLGSVHPHSAAWGNCRRLPRQAAEQRRARIEPADRVDGARRRHRPSHSHAPAASWTASRTIKSAGVRLGEPGSPFSLPRASPRPTSKPVMNYAAL